MANAFKAATGHERFQHLNDMRAFGAKPIELWDKDRGQAMEMKAEYAESGGPLIWSNTQHSVELIRTANIVGPTGLEPMTSTV